MALVCPSPIEDLSLYSCLRPRSDPYRWESAALEDTQCTVCRSNERSVDHLRCGHWVCSSCTLQEQSRSAGVQCPVCGWGGEEMFRSKLRRTSVAKGGRASSFFPRLVPFVTEKIPPKESSGSRNIPLRTETPAPARGDPPQEEMSEMDTSEGTVEVQCSFPVSGVQPLDWKEFTPEKSTDSRKISFRFRCPGSGAFRCSSTGLVFVVTKEAELQYRPVQWDEALLQSSGRTPAGPLYDIECPERALCELHLPHCEPEHADLSQSHLSVAHISDPGLSLVEPERITQTHVVISVRELSLFGLVWNIFIKHREVSGQVLLFCTPQKHKVNMFLLPRNISVDQVRSKQRSTTQYIDAPPKCKLVIDRHYSVVCPGAKKIQPPRALFDMDHEPNFHQSFELRLPPDSGPLSIAVREEGSTEAEKREVWGYELDLTEPPGSADPSPQRDSRTRLSSVRSEFVSRVSDAVLKQLLDKLQEEKVLNIEEAERASVCQTSADKARHLVDVVLKKGDGAASVLIKAFCDLDPRSALCQKLKDS